LPEEIAVTSTAFRDPAPKITDQLKQTCSSNLVFKEETGIGEWDFNKLWSFGSDELECMQPAVEQSDISPQGAPEAEGGTRRSYTAAMYPAPSRAVDGD